MLLHSGVFERDGELISGPGLDRQQTGYGPGYRIYQAGDGGWFALVIPDEAAWQRLATLPGVAQLPAVYAPLRGGRDDAHARAAEAVLEAAFATAPVAEWAGRLRGAGLLAEPIAPLDRDGFRRGILEDPVNVELGRVAVYETADWGHFEQIGPLLRCGPDGGQGPRLMLPGVGEHTAEILAELGFSTEEIDTLVASKVARQG
jgi:crotonobetainyl-CoA:carnitine CoA-transferase CaiB-like acyl-CoA transferase